MGLRDRVRKLSSSTGDIDQTRLQDRFGARESAPIAEAVPRTRVTIAGEVQAIQVVPRAGSPWLEVTIADGTGKAVAVFTGRRRIAGLECGRAVVLEGVAGKTRGRLQLMNPAYTLLG